MDNHDTTLTPLQVAQAFFDANERGNAAAVRALFAAEATYVIPGDPLLVPWVGARDRDGIADYMRELAAHAEFDHFEVSKIMVDGEDVVALGRFAMHFASGGRLDDPYAIHLVVRDGLIRSYVMHEDSLNLARELTGETTPGTLPVAERSDTEADLRTITETAMAAARAVVPGDVGGVVSMFDKDTATFLFDYDRPRSITIPQLRERFGANVSAGAAPAAFDVLEFHPALLGPDAAWSWQISRARVVDEEGTTTELTWRVTDVWRRVGGRWRAVHEHGSFPVDLATRIADLTSAP